MLAGFVIGTTLSMAATQSMSSGSHTSCTMTTVPVAEVTYYRSRGRRYPAGEEAAEGASSHAPNSL